MSHLLQAGAALALITGTMPLLSPQWRPIFTRPRPQAKVQAAVFSLLQNGKD